MIGRRQGIKSYLDLLLTSFKTSYNLKTVLIINENDSNNQIQYTGMDAEPDDSVLRNKFINYIEHRFLIQVIYDTQQSNKELSIAISDNMLDELENIFINLGHKKHTFGSSENEKTIFFESINWQASDEILYVQNKTSTIILNVIVNFRIKI